MIHIQGISKHYGSKVLFEEAEAHLGYRSRVALIGPNGAGKSTLIRIILNQEEPDRGLVSRASHLTIGYLAQETPLFSGRSILEETMRLDGRRETLLAAREQFEKLFETSTASEDVTSDQLDRYGRILEELELLDEYRLESRAQEILMGMGFKLKDFHRPLTELSGGWLMRVALARILLMDPDLLLLDEPTNHLDLESLLWLEEFLLGFRGALLLVSHDTTFLNRVVHEVLEIDQRRLWAYRGNLDAYVLQKEERLTILRAQYAGQQTKIAELERFIERFGAKATKARQAQSRVKQLEKMERIELPEDASSIRFRFPPAPHSGKEVVSAREAGVSFGKKKVFQKLNWTLTRGSRVAIVGVNGAGKTTLLKLLSGQLEVTEGSCVFGHEVKVGYYAQHQSELLDLNKTILQELEETAPALPISQVRAIAGAFLFTGSDVEKKCRVLSGGEKARVVLAKLLLSPSNFLILDEPTNHLDRESREVLLEALESYTGTLCLVSHDRSFVSPLVSSVLEIIPNTQASDLGSEVVQLLGSYDDYLEKKLKEVAEQSTLKGAHTLSGMVNKKTTPVPDIEQKHSTVESAKGPSHNQRRTWDKERCQLELDITKLEKRQNELHILLGEVQTYDNKAQALQWMEEQRKIEQSLGQKLVRWEEICALLG